MNHHMCETWSQHTWWLCSRPGFGPLKSGCDRCRTNTGRRRMLPHPQSRTGWRWDRGMRGDRKEAGWRTRWRQLRRGPSLSCGGINGQMSRVWRAGPRHDPFISAWVSPARASWLAWTVASVCSASSARHDYIFLFYKKSYIHMYNLYSILKIPDHDVLLVRRLYPVSPDLLP
jgi:hypothetical protein